MNPDSLTVSDKAHTCRRYNSILDVHQRENKSEEVVGSVHNLVYSKKHSKSEEGAT